MSAVEMREEVHQLIDQIDDRLLKAVYAMLGTYVKKEDDPVLGYETDGTPVTASTFLEQAEKAVAEAKEGKGITVEELRKRSEEWLNRTR
ncbi:MAG: hypothetical protein AAFY48_01545 [Bacteroidota bacterium]